MDREPGEGADARRRARLIPAEWIQATPAERIAAAAFLATVAAATIWYLAPSVVRSWYYRSDEYVIIGEIVRFLHLDFRQHYFDLPATPLMFVSAAAWSIVYAAASLIGAAPHGLDDFTFHHLPLLFEMVRATCLAAGVIAIVLVFLLAWKLTNFAGASVAATLVAMNPTFAWTESCIRPEPAAICLIIVSIFAISRALEKKSLARIEIRWIAPAGALAGLAAALRFHSITATLPLLLMILLTSGWPAPEYPAQLAVIWKRTLQLALVLALAAMAGIRTGILASTWLAKAWPKAFDSIFLLCAAAALAIAIVWALRLSPKTVWLSDRLLHPRVFILAAGSIAGVLAGTPTILWRPQNFFQAINMYTTSYLDVDRMGWPIARHLAWLVQFYMKAIAPDRLSLALIVLGAVLILIRRDRRVLPYLAASALFFVARPLNIMPWPHQMIAWLPIFGVVAGYAAASFYDWIPARWRMSALAALIASMVASMTAAPMTLGPRAIAQKTEGEEQRMHSIALATDWIHANAEQGAAVAISYYCFNSDVFFAWLHFLEAPVPAWADDGRRYMIWWGERSALSRLRGYACATPADIDNIKRKLDLQKPSEGSDPFRDAGFERLQSFGSGPAEVDVFRFDFSNPETARP